jgi:hypothetical protein
MKKIDHPIILYMIISSVSFVCAFAFFKIGGSLAEITGSEGNPLGFTFKAGGAIAGFLLLFAYSRNTMLKFYERKRTLVNVRVYLQGKPLGFVRSHAYEAIYKTFDEDTGDAKEYPTTPCWEAGYLTVIVKNVTEKDFITIRIKNSEATIWESESFHSRSPKVAELTQID